MINRFWRAIRSVFYFTNPQSRKAIKFFRKGSWVVTLIALVSGCATFSKNYDPQKKFGPDQLQKEVSMLRQTYERCHPGLYWYTPKNQMNQYFDELEKAATDSMTETQFQLQIARTLAKINCGHTSVRNSKAAAKYHSPLREPIFPLQVKVWEPDSMVVFANAFKGDTLLKRGTSIYTINGRPVKEILDSLCGFISGDGYNNHFKYQLLSNNFPFWYKMVFGLSEQYTIECKPLNGMVQKLIIKSFNFLGADSINKAAKQQQAPTKQPQGRTRRNDRYRKLRIDTANSLAIMELNSFSKGNLPAFFATRLKPYEKIIFKTWQ